MRYRPSPLSHRTRPRLSRSRTTSFQRSSDWREGGRRLRAAAGATPAEAPEAQRRKRLELERVTPKEFAREITPEGFLFWRKSKGFDPGTTLYTDRVILHNFLSTLKIDNSIKEVPRHRCPSGCFPRYDSSEVLKYECFCEASRGSENHYSQ